MDKIDLEPPSPRKMKLQRLKLTKKMSPEELELEKMKIYGDDYVPSKHSPFVHVFYAYLIQYSMANIMRKRYFQVSFLKFIF